MNAVIFDLDGTLWDTSAEVVKCWNKTLEKLNTGKSIDKSLISSFMGKTNDEIISLFLPEFEYEEACKIFSEISKSESEYLKTHGAELYKDVEETLKILYPKYKLCIVSNCQLSYLEAFLSHYDFYEFFEDYECAGRTKRSKGENIKTIISRNKFEKAIYVGDTLSDQKACEYANVPFVYASYGFKGATDYEAIMHSFSDIIEVSKRLFSIENINIK